MILAATSISALCCWVYLPCSLPLRLPLHYQCSHLLDSTSESGHRPLRWLYSSRPQRDTGSSKCWLPKWPLTIAWSGREVGLDVEPHCRRPTRQRPRSRDFHATHGRDTPIRNLSRTLCAESHRERHRSQLNWGSLLYCFSITAVP